MGIYVHSITVAIITWCAHFIQHSNHGGRDSVVGIATRYELDGLGIDSRWGPDFPRPFILEPLTLKDESTSFVRNFDHHSLRDTANIPDDMNPQAHCQELQISHEFMFLKHNSVADSPSFTHDKQPHVTDEAVCNPHTPKIRCQAKTSVCYSLAASACVCVCVCV